MSHSGKRRGQNLSGQISLHRDDFSLDVKLDLTVGITALFGPSGSGKTTLLHAIAGLVPAEGRLELAGRVLFDSSQSLAPHRRRVGLVFQDYRLFPHLSVRDNILYGWTPGQADKARIDLNVVVDALDIGRHLDKKPGSLSGGEKQRVALGRALCANPDLLLMDEPLAAVDVELRRQILPFLREVHRDYGIPIVYVSHALPEILALTEDVLVLKAGRVVAHGEVFDVLGRSLKGDEGAFAVESSFDVTVTENAPGDEVTVACVGEQLCVLPRVDLAVGETGRVVLRPEDVMLSAHRLERVSARNQLVGRVERISELHGRRLVHLRLAEGAVLHAELTQRAIDELGIVVGGDITCVVKTSAFRWLGGMA